MTDIVERLREFAGERYPDDICGKQCMGDAADEIERLRAALYNLAAAVRAREADPQDDHGTSMLLADAVAEAGVASGGR